MSGEYPTASVVQEHLKHLAIELGDPTLKPFRVDMVRVHGGKPPIYSLVILSQPQELLRHRLEQLINRPLTCGVNSFMLKADEVNQIICNRT